MRHHWGYALIILIPFLLTACDQGSQLMSQAQQAYDAATDAVADAGLLPGSSKQGGGSMVDQLLGSTTGAGSADVEIKKNIDPKYAFIQTYLSGQWANSPYKRNCYGKELLNGNDNTLNTGDFVEFSFEGDTVTQYYHYVAHGKESILKTVARIESATQPNKRLGQGRTLVGEIKVKPISTKQISGISGGVGTPHGFSKPRVFLVSGDFSAEEPDFSGKAIYSNGVTGGPPQLYSCSGSFQLIDPVQ